MAEAPFKPDGDRVDDEGGGVVLLTRLALGAPDPPPQAERESRERLLAQFRSGALSPRPLHDDSADLAGSAALGWTQRIARTVRRLLGR